jgi:membrane protein
MRYASVKDALLRTCVDVDRNHTLQMAAALSYYFVLALFPALIFVSAAIAYLPIHDLSHQTLILLAPFLPAEGMEMIRKVLDDVIRSNKGTVLSFGLLGTFWTVSGGFAAMIEALNVAFDVKDDRPFWKTRPLALGLAFVVGTLMLTSACITILGPRFGDWLAGRVHLSQEFVMLWPYLHWSIVVMSTVVAVETLYFLAPNVKMRFLATLPGAILAVGCCVGLSHLLGVYFRHFGNFNRTYGTLGAAIALMIWLYWMGFAILVGAELNCELAKISSRGKLQEKHEPNAITTMDLAA